MITRIAHGFLIFSFQCIFLFTYTMSFAQSHAWTVITSAHDTLRSCIVGGLENNMVNLICGSSVVQISVDSLSIVTRHGESHFWSGAGYGTLVGAAAGTLVGVATYQKPAGPTAFDFGPGVQAFGGAILGGVAGFTIGGIVGAGSGGDDRYNLSEETTAGKIKILGDLGGEGSKARKIPVEKSAGRTDVLYLNDGSVIRGTIVGEVGTEGYWERVTIRTIDGQTRTCEGSTISRVERGQ